MHLEVQLHEVPVEHRNALVKNLTETLVNVLRLPADVARMVSVHLNFYCRSEVGHGGALINTASPGLFRIDAFTMPLHHEQKRDLARHLTNALCDSLGLPRAYESHVFVTLHEMSPDNMACGGHLLSEALFV